MNELSTFVIKGSSWAADEGHTDDLIVLCIIFMVSRPNIL